jgi:Ca2+-binding RTX toxin-like protein
MMRATVPFYGVLVAAALCVASMSAVAQAAPPTCFGQRATIVGTKGDDMIEGTAGADVIVGLRGDDRIRGLGGADFVCGSGGHDRARGGRGNDKINGGGILNVLFGGAGDDLVIAGGGQDDGSVLHGGGGDDRLRGGDSVDDFWPGPGNDAIYGRGSNGDETVHYEHSTSALHVDLRARTATGQGRDRLLGIWDVVGSPQADVILGNDGERPGLDGNILEGSGGADVIRGRGGGDLLFDGLFLPPKNPRTRGADVLRGGGGADGLVLGNGDDRAFGGDGGDGGDGFSIQGWGHDLVGGERVRTSSTSSWARCVRACSPAGRRHGRAGLSSPASGTCRAPGAPTS